MTAQRQAIINMMKSLDEEKLAKKLFELEEWLEPSGTSSTPEPTWDGLSFDRKEFYRTLVIHFVTEIIHGLLEQLQSMMEPERMMTAEEILADCKRARERFKNWRYTHEIDIGWEILRLNDLIMALASPPLQRESEHE